MVVILTQKQEIEMNWKMMIWKMIRRPPCKWVCRPPKAYEQIWNGLSGKVETCPFDCQLDHWVLVPKRLSIWAHSHNASGEGREV